MQKKKADHSMTEAEFDAALDKLAAKLEAAELADKVDAEYQAAKKTEAGQ